MPPASISGVGVVQEETLRYVRSPRDLLRLVVHGVVALLFVVITIGLEDSVLGFESDLIRLFDFVTPTIERVLHGALEWTGLCIVTGILVWTIATKRFRLLGYCAIAYLVGGLLMWAVLAIIDRHEPTLLVNELAARAGVTASAPSGEIGFAEIAAAFVVIGPFVSTRWRRAGVVLLATLVLLRFLVSYHLPGNVLVSIPTGAAVGAAILLVFGRPDRRPTEAAIAAALRATGLGARDVHAAAVDARGSTPYFVTADDGEDLFVKVLGEEERAADLMFRLYRYLRLKDVGDDRPFSSLRRTVEHEALVSLVARDVGVRTPRMRGVARVGLDSMLVAYDRIDGSSIDRLDPSAVTDDLMRELFREVAMLRRHRVAHRDLRRANMVAGADGSLWLIDFGFAELAVDEGTLDADVAQAIAALAVVVGAARPVRMAIEVLGRDAVAACLPRLQLQALSGATRAALRSHKGLLGDVQHEVEQQAGVTEVRFAELERLDKRTVLMVVVLVAATYFLLPQFADLPAIVHQVQDANWWWAGLVVLASVLTYIGAATGLGGAVAARVRAGPLLVCQVAAEFTSKLAPASVGGMALNVRFLQKQGIDAPVAVSGVGLSTVAGLVVHVSMIGVFLVWAGRSAFGSFHLPDLRWFVVGLVAIVLLGALTMAVPFTRHVVTRRLWPVLRRAFDGVSEVFRHPSKLLALFGGSALVSIGNLLALYFCILAFGGGLSLATVGAVYLVGSAVASAAPTPGGIGAVEAALISGLVAAGLDNAVAVPAVFLYRLATFWLPVLPGWISFTWLQRHDYV